MKAIHTKRNLTDLQRLELRKRATAKGKKTKVGIVRPRILFLEGNDY